MKDSTVGFICIILFFCFIFVLLGGGDVTSSPDSDVNKIIAAKQIVRGMVNYPDTLDFHDYSYSPIINGNTVTLKFTAKNAFGVPETHLMDIEVK